MESLIKIFADFNNADNEGRFRLNTIGTINDLKTQNIMLIPGLKILLDNDEGFTVIGIIEFSASENIWVAKVDEGDFPQLRKSCGLIVYWRTCALLDPGHKSPIALSQCARLAP